MANIAGTSDDDVTIAKKIMHGAGDYLLCNRVKFEFGSKQKGIQITKENLVASFQVEFEGPSNVGELTAALLSKRDDLLHSINKKITRATTESVITDSTAAEVSSGGVRD
eukprot:GFYU01003236.1.p1 GENE.GFYU01003236.1~~GFYU01003236.1.p1  ORF type:complete len:124 (+),score=37.43 GFYU01003236.1:43-372(+)